MAVGGLERFGRPTLPKSNPWSSMVNWVESRFTEERPAPDPEIEGRPTLTASVTLGD
jgi:hypothetical protein